MIRMTLSEYLRVPKDYRGVWTNERWDIPNWADIREKHLGKRTLMTNINGGTCLVVEGMGVIGNEKYIIFGKMEYIRISNNDTSFSVTMVHRFR